MAQKKSENSADQLHVMRHSMAHIMAAAIQALHPKAKFGVGPVIENGFYYDVDIDQTLSPEDLKAVTKKMQEIIKKKFVFERQEASLDEAITLFKQADQPYKVELLNDLKQHGTTVAKDIDREQLGTESVEKIATVSLYKTGDFIDLCRGPHLEDTGQAGAFKLTKVSGAYWRGDENNPQLQRIYGVAFANKDELNTYLEQLAEAEKRDHRKLGKQLDIFEQSEIVGAGLPMFTPKGAAMINAMMNFVRDINRPDGFEEVRTGHVTRTELYDISGHSAKFGDDLFVVEAGEDKLALKPMNCPHHTQLYARDLRSYRDLPIKFAEFTTLHRNEIKGALGGLTRVRALTMDDAHAFIRPDQIEQEVGALVKQVDRVMTTYGLDYRMRLSLRDPQQPDAYLGGDEIWNKAESMLRRLAENNKIDYHEVEGEAAFYGPKMDFMAVDALGREWQVSTIQLDFNMPARFKLSYINEKGDKEQPVMIHRALNGSFERMLGVLIEHYGGNFPTWLAPEQVRLLTVNDSGAIVTKAQEWQQQLKAAGIRADLDLSSESVGKKIRSASLMKVPYTIVVGEKEVESGSVSPRIRADLGDKEISLPFNEFISKLQDEIQTRTQGTTL